MNICVSSPLFIKLLKTLISLFSFRWICYAECGGKVFYYYYVSISILISHDFCFILRVVVLFGTEMFLIIFMVNCDFYPYIVYFFCLIYRFLAWIRFVRYKNNYPAFLCFHSSGISLPISWFSVFWIAVFELCLLNITFSQVFASWDNLRIDSSFTIRKEDKPAKPIPFIEMNPMFSL